MQALSWRVKDFQGHRIPVASFNYSTVCSKANSLFSPHLYRMKFNKWIMLLNWLEIMRKGSSVPAHSWFKQYIPVCFGFLLALRLPGLKKQTH